MTGIRSGVLAPQAELELEEELEALALAPGGEALVIGADTRRRVTRSTRPGVTDAPFRYICCLEVDGIPSSSGTLIGPRTVLTARHCVDGYSPGQMRAIPGRDGAAEPLRSARAARFHVAPGAWADASPTDYAIIELAEPIGRSVGWWTRGARRMRRDPVGQSISDRPLPVVAGRLSVNISGYPSDKPDGIGCPSQARCGTEQWRSYDRTVRSDGGMLYYVNDTFPGHSGSPVWVRRHWSMGGRVLVAIHVGGGANTNSAVRISAAIMRFIVANTR